MSGEVRLTLRERDDSEEWYRPGKWTRPTHIALPLAQHEARERVVEAARVLRGAQAIGDDQARGAAMVALVHAVDAYEAQRAGGG